MTTLLTKDQQNDLRAMLETPTMRKALDEALSGVFKEKRNQVTLEGCAMAYNFNEGAFAVLNRLQALAEITPGYEAPSARRWRATKD